MSSHDPNEETIASLLHTIALIREAAGCGGEVMLSDLPAFVKGLRAERDVARQWLCHVLAKPSMVTGLDKPGEGKPRDFAAEQGWDCFRAEADANNERFRRTDGE
jgi:hypothetical protein